MKKFNWKYWVPNSLLLLAMMASGVMYFAQPEMAAAAFADLGYPAYSMYFNAIAKLLGGVAIALPYFSRWTKEWAYAGYLYIILLAFQAIAVKQPANIAGMFIFIALWGLSYWQFRKTASK